jgi:hypothetical protein
MANPWERNWATSDTAAPAAVVASPDEQTSPASPAAAPWERNWASEKPAKAATNSAADSAIEGYLTGAGAGFRDEIYAASKASGLPEALGGFRAIPGAVKLAIEKASGEPGEASKIYDQSIDEIRARQKSAQEDHPVAFGTAQVGGSFLPASRAMKLTGAGATLGGAMLRSGGAGMILGAVEGAGNANGDLIHRAIGAAEGAPVGAVVGAAAPVVGQLVGKGISAIANRGGTESAGAGKVLSALERDGVAPADLQSRLSALGPDAMIADIGPNATQQAATIAASPGKGQQTVRAAIDARNAGASTRVGDAVDYAMGGRVNVGQLERDIIQRRSQNAAPLYDQAYQTPLPPIAEVQEVLNTPAGKMAAARAAKLSQNEGIPFDPNSVRGVDLIKRTLDDVVSMGQRAGRNNEARIISTLRDKLVDAVDNHVPEYAMARNAFAGESAIKDALAGGRTIFKDNVTPEQLHDTLSRMTASEQDAFLQGARSSIQTVMGTARNDAAAVRTLFKKGFNQEKLELVLGPQAADHLLKQVGFETASANTSQRVIGNSETAARVAGREDLNPSSSGLGIRDSYAAGGLMGAARGLGLKLVDHAIDAVRTGRQKEIEAAMGDILTMRGSDRDKAVASVMREALRRDRSGTLARHVRDLASNAALAGSGPYAPAVGAGAVGLVSGR